MLLRRLSGLSAVCLAIFVLPVLAAPSLGAQQRLEDHDALWQAIEREYAYLPRDLRPLRAARAADRRQAGAATDRDTFVAVLERSLARLRDDHVALSERSRNATRALPMETDVWPAWRDGRATVEAVRAYGEADVAGLKPGDRVLKIDGVAVDQAMHRWLSQGEANDASRDWALRHALAGPRSGTVRVEIEHGGTTRVVFMERGVPPASQAASLSARRIGEGRDLGYLRMRGAIGDPLVARQFAAALQSLAGTRALILDLREANGEGGRAAVEAILARFAAVRMPWRIREDARGRRTSDEVGPVGTPPRVPILVLVDRWTAGDAEALAAGLAAVTRARLVGTRMAGLRGELDEVVLPHSGIRVRFPVQRVLHIDGSPREALRPAVEVDLAAPNGGPGDPILYQALKILEK